MRSPAMPPDDAKTLEQTSTINVDLKQESITPTDEPVETPKSVPKSRRFWLVFISLLLPAFAANLNATILSTVLPVIVEEIHAGEQFIWINASYAIACAAIQPMLGQLANIFGRRYPMLCSLLLFTVGSGISGGANSFAMIVAGRTVQGLGGGGIMMLMEVIVSDLLPQRERPKYMGMILGVMTLGVLLGPSVGGAFVKNSSWKWAFYINVPIGGGSFLVALPLLRLKAPANINTKSAVARIDFVGNFIFLAATCSILVGLVMGGQTYPWSSFRVILPIVLGAVGWILFGFHQGSAFVKEPTIPLRIFSNRTALIGYILVFISSMLLEWIVYYLPYYFQTLKGSSPIHSSVQVLAFNIFLIPSAAINGIVMGKTGKYKPIHFSGFAFLAIGTGLFTTMGADTSIVKLVFWQLFASYGLGCLINSTLPAIQSSLPEKDVATATGVHAFLRSLGFVWGFTIPSLVFNGQIKVNSNIVKDLSVQAQIIAGEAYAAGGSHIVKSLDGEVKDQVLHLYTVSLRNVWYTALAFSLIGFLLVFVEKSLLLRQELETEFGLKEENRSTNTPQESV